MKKKTKLLWRAPMRSAEAVLQATATMATETESLTGRLQRIYEAVRKQFRYEGIYDDTCLYWTEEIYEDVVIVKNRADGCFYSIPYTIADDEVSFGEPVKVEHVYVLAEAGNPTPTTQTGQEGQAGEVNSSPASDAIEGVETSVQSISPTLVRQAEGQPDGTKWRCQVIAFGMSLTRDIWSRAIFEQSLSLWEGIPCYANHMSQADYVNRPERDIKDKVGWWSDFTITTQGLDATLTLLPSAEWLKKDLLFCAQNSQPDFLAFSIFVRTYARQVKGPDGEPATEHTKIVQPLSTDCVTQAAAQGRIHYALASMRGANLQQQTRGDLPMNKALLLRLFTDNKRRFEVVRQSLIASNTAGVTAQTTESQLVDVICADAALTAQCETLITMADTAIAAAAAGVQTPNPAAPATPVPTAQAATIPAGTPAQQQPTDATTQSLLGRLQDNLIAQAWRDSGVPEGVAKKRREALGAAATLEQHLADIAVAQMICGEFAQSGNVADNFGGRVQGGLDSADKLRIAINKGFELTFESFQKNRSSVEGQVQQAGNSFATVGQAEWDATPAITSLRELYTMMTGDKDLTGVSRYRRLTAQAQNPWLPSDFTVLMADAMHKRLQMGYREVDFGWQRIATIKPLKDFRTQHVVRYGYLADLPTVDTAAAESYSTMTAPADTEETYTPGTKGALIELTRRDLLNDDLNAFSRNIYLLGRSAHRTLAKLVWLTSLFNNPTLTEDSKALYHADHNNLITDAFGATGLKNALIALMSQTEPGTGEKIDFSPDGLTLAVPVQLYWDALVLTDLNNEPGGNTSGLDKELRGLGIFVQKLPILTDTNDWALFANKMDVEHVEVGFIGGHVEPEFFVLNDELHEKAFNTDIILRTKARHEYGAAPVDFRGSVKAAVVGGS